MQICTNALKAETFKVGLHAQRKEQPLINGNSLISAHSPARICLSALH
jgi:hypothetical protein